MIKLYVFDECANSSQNGIGTYVFDLCQCLSGEIQITILSFNDSVSSFQKEDRDGVTYMRFPFFCGGAFLDNYEIGLSIIRMEVNDAEENIFLLNYFFCDALLRGLKEYFPLSKTVFVIHDQIWTERLLGDIEKFKTIMNESDSQGDGTGRYLMLKRLVMREKEMYQLSGRVVVLNRDTMELLKTIYGVDEQKISLIPHGREIHSLQSESKEKIKALLGVNQDDQIMLFVGRTTKCKGFEAMLSAFEELALRFHRLKLVILGNVYDIETVLRLCPKNRTKIIYAGHVAKSELMMWYHIADIGIIPSYCEQLGYVGVEMLACGVPIIASDGIGLRSMFRDGYNAVVAPIENHEKPNRYVQNLIMATERLCHLDDSQRQQLRVNAHNTYMAHYTINKMKKSYLRLFEDMTLGKDVVSNKDGLSVLDRDDVYRLMLKCNDMVSRGFLTGRIGVVVALMEYAHKYKVTPISDFCIFSINKTITNIPDNVSLDFESGMLGIGFALDYLRFLELVDIDTSVVCEAIDKRVMHYSVLRMRDLTLEKGLEGLLMYVNIHMYNNKGKSIFAESFFAEIREAINQLPINISDSLRRQTVVFEHMRIGKYEKPAISLAKFVMNSVDNDLSLCHGLAGKLVRMMNCN